MNICIYISKIELDRQGFFCAVGQIPNMLGNFNAADFVGYMMDFQTRFTWENRNISMHEIDSVKV